MTDDDLTVAASELPAEPAPDENWLGAILSKALKSITEIGGLDRARLVDVVGRQAYDGLLTKNSGREAIDRYLESPPRTKRLAGKLLALQLVRNAERPDPGLTDRVERELEDHFGEGYEARSKATPAVKAQQRSGQRVANPDLVELAKREDISSYRQARLNPRGKQGQHHGV